MKDLIVSVIYTFGCNYHCPYCFLGDRRNDKRTIPHEVLEQRLKELRHCGYTPIFDVFGGDVECTCSKDEIGSLLSLLEKYTDKKISFTTMLYEDTFQWLYNDKRLELDFSLNVERGRQYEETLERLKQIPMECRKELTTMVVVLPSILKQGAKATLDYIEELGVGTVTFLQYYKSKWCKKIYNIKNKDYESFMIDVINCYRNSNYSFEINNLHLWKDDYTPFKSSHIFILPNGNYATLSYDKDGYESFYEFDTIEQYEKVVKEEMVEHTECLNCGYFGKCLAEHIRPTEEGDVCSGLPNLRKLIFGF